MPSLGSSPQHASEASSAAAADYSENRFHFIFQVPELAEFADYTSLITTRDLIILGLAIAPLILCIWSTMTSRYQRLLHREAHRGRPISPLKCDPKLNPLRMRLLCFMFAIVFWPLILVVDLCADVVNWVVRFAYGDFSCWRFVSEVLYEEERIDEQAKRDREKAVERMVKAIVEGKVKWEATEKEMVEVRFPRKLMAGLQLVEACEGARV